MANKLKNNGISLAYPGHVNAKTVDEVVNLLKEYGETGKIIAGGTDLVRLLKSKTVEPRLIVNLKTVPGLKYITEDDDGLQIGALTTLREITMSHVIQQVYPVLAEAAYSVASPSIRHMGTVVGNLCQDVQCWYYRRQPILGKTFYCKRKGGKVCHAVAGENMYHAIIGGNACYAASPSDMAPALIALGATLKIASHTGKRTVALDEFYTSMGTNLKAGELITSICVPRPGLSSKQRFLKFRERKTIDFALSSVAVVINSENGVVTKARIVLGGIAPVPYRAVEAEQVITGKKVSEGLAETTAKAAVNKAKPLRDNTYKVTLTRALVKRALLLAS